MKKVTSIPAGGLKFELTPGLKINSITPLATGNLVIKPASPLTGQTTETIAITDQLVGTTFPGCGQEMIQEGTTALPLIVVFASEGEPMFPVFVPGASIVDILDEVRLLSAPLGMWKTSTLITVGVEPSGLTQLPDIPCSEMLVIAHADNTHPIYFGDADIDSVNTPGWLKREGALIPRMTNADQGFVVAAAGHTGQKLHLQTR